MRRSSPYRTRRVSVKWRGREVHNPVARKLVAAQAILVGVPLMLLGIALWLVVIPLSLPWHFLLRALGTPGFTRREGTTIKYTVPLWGMLLSLAPLAALVLL